MDNRRASQEEGGGVPGTFGPPLVEPVVERQQRIQRYIRAYRWNSLMPRFIPFSCIIFVCLFSDKLILAITGFNTFLNASLLFNLQPVPGWFPLKALAYFVVIGGGLACIFLLYTFMVSYVLPGLYGVQRPSFVNWLLMRFVLPGQRFLMWLLWVETAYFFIVLLPSVWWFATASSYLLFSIVGAYIQPFFVLPLLYMIKPLPDGPLLQQLTPLFDRSNIHVFVMDFANQKNGQLKPATYLCPWGATYRLLLTSRLVRKFPTNEIAVLVAHDMGHYVHLDHWKILISRFFSALAILFIFSLTAYTWQHLLVISQAGIQGPLIIPGLFFLLSFFTPVLANLLHKKYRRYLEYKADEYALQTTRNLRTFQQAMKRLASYNAIPVRLSLRQWLFSSYPLLEQRLKHAESYAAKIQVPSS